MKQPNVKNAVSKLTLVILFCTFSLFTAGQTIEDNIDFRPRLLKTGDPTDGTGIYKIRGDFSLIGNSNLTAAPYFTGYGDNTSPMVFIDVDSEAETVNSSKATLQLSDENGADHTCTDIVFAGLYWGGIGDEAELGETGAASWNVSPRVYLANGQNYEGWTLTTVTSASTSLLFLDTKFTFTRGGVSFTIYIWGHPMAPTYEVNGSSRSLNAKITSRSQPETNSDMLVHVFELPVPVEFTSGGHVIKVKQLTCAGGKNTISASEYNNMALVALETNDAVVLDKTKVKFKHGSESEYLEVVAEKEAGNDVLFFKTGVTGRNNIYSAYADVTDYVKEHGMGEYTVADVATTDGCSHYLRRDGGTIRLVGNSSGKSAAWGLVVIYQNNKMNWRNISVFDGYSYIENKAGSTVTKEYDIDIDGIQTIQEGPVNMKLGGIAFEGDRALGGDYLRIKKADGSWLDLSHPGNSTTNFFNSSIYTGGNPRTPENSDNFGADVFVFNIPNEQNSVIANNQTSLNFKSGTNSDNYVINTFAFAVDAYIPEIDPYNRVNKISGIPVGGQENLTVKPGEEIEYVLEVRNVGNEDFTEAYIDIPIPYNAVLVGFTSSYYQEVHGAVDFDEVNSVLQWKFTSDLPVLDDSPVLATLTYTIKATDDCFIINGNCLSGITIQGYLSGKGAVSGTVFDNVKLVHRYEIIGDCFYQPITDPTVIDFDKGDFDCSSVTGFRTFVYPEDLGGLSYIPLTEIKTYFPSDVRFYDVIDEQTGEPLAGAVEYTDQNPFPKLPGKYFYYGTYAVLGVKCWQKFSIHVFAVNNNLCEGDSLGLIFKSNVPVNKDTIDLERFDYFIYETDSEQSPYVEVTPQYRFEMNDDGKYVKYQKCRGCIDWEIDIESSFIQLHIKPIPVITGFKPVLYVDEVFRYVGIPSGGIWTSSDPAILEINNDGTAYAHETGEVSLTYSSNGCTESVAVKVLRENLWIGENRGANPKPGGLEGIENSYWSITSNWTGGRLPQEEERVVYHPSAVDLHVNSLGNAIGGIYAVQGVDNATTANLIIPPGSGLKLTVNTSDSPAVNFTNGAGIIVQSEDPEIIGSVNGTFIVPENTEVEAFVNFYTKGKGPVEATTVDEMSWQYFGIPVKSFKAGYLDGAFVRVYDETKTIIENVGGDDVLIYYWHWLDNESVMSPVTGYEISRKENYSGRYSFFGELNTSDIDTVLTVTPGAYFKGQHVVSNPYTAALNIKTGLVFGPEQAHIFTKAVYLFHAGTPDEWQAQVGTDGEKLPGRYLVVPQENAGKDGLPLYIPSMQGFVVQLDSTVFATEANEAARTLSFRYAGVGDVNYPMRVDEREQEESSLVISLFGNGGLKDRVWMFIQTGSTRNFDNGYDGRKMLGVPDLAQLYFCEDDGMYQVSTVPDIDEMYLGFKAEKAVRDYTLTFHGNNADGELRRLYLIDLNAKVVTEITDCFEYHFTADNEIMAEKRFVIAAHKDWLQDENGFVSIYQRNGDIIFINDYEEEVLIVVYDSRGMSVRRFTIAPSDNVFIKEADWKTGIYVVGIYSDDVRVSSGKIIVR